MTMAKLNLSTRFALILSIVFLGGLIASGIILWQTLQRRAQAEVTDKGLLLVATMNSVRSYTGAHVRPMLADKIATEPEFILETVPAFSARTVFDGIRLNEEYANYLYKEATLNPTNPTDLADDFERAIVEQMRQDEELKELSGYRTVEGEQLFYIARPLAVSQESCLECHSDPAIAPASLIQTYGSENGFGWQLTEVVAAQMVYVPAGEVFGAALRSFLVIIAIFIAVFAAAVVVLNVLLKKLVIQPVHVMGSLALELSADKMVPQELESDRFSTVTERTDEVGQLARVFRNMARQVYTRTQSLKQQVQELQIEIDVIKRQKQVEEIVESDFFKDLQTKARRMRQEHGQQWPDPTAPGTD
jgi:methyl-accepting chemotaxis protein